MLLSLHPAVLAAVAIALLHDRCLQRLICADMRRETLSPEQGDAPQPCLNCPTSCFWIVFLIQSAFSGQLILALRSLCRALLPCALFRLGRCLFLPCPNYMECVGIGGRTIVQDHCIILQNIYRYKTSERREYMEVFNPQHVADEAQRVQVNSAELVARITRAIREDGVIEPLKGLYLVRSSSRTGPVYGVSEPSFCVIAQGSKEVFLGEARYQYDPAHYLLTTVGLPVVSQIREASAEQPYLSIRLQLDSTLVGSVLVETDHPSPRGEGEVKAIDVSPLNASLLDAVLRLIRLLDSPADARVLAPLVTREIVYRLLVGAQGARLRHIAVLGADTHRIARAADLLQKDFRKPLRVERIAQALGMSVSGLHHQFKAVTSMSPLQYQKRLRLQEARRLMFGEHLDAASAGSRVGYDNAAHFNREYKSLFGLPPIRDVERLREAASTSMLQEVAGE